MVVLAGRLAEQGLQELEAARQQRDDAPRKHNLASAAMMTGDLERAQKELTAALERSPDFASAHASRATLLLMQGDTEQARAELATADKLAPDLSLVQWARAELALRDGEPQQARTIAERALRARPSFDAHLRMGMLLRALGDADALRKNADALLALVPADRKPEVREMIKTVLGPAALGDAPLPDTATPDAANAEPNDGADPPAPGEHPLQLGDQAPPDPSQPREKKGPRLGDPRDRLRLKLDP
jgi:tetratricopeptide (TPR) repeat protein